jgi:hypothetical protein
VQDKAVEKSHKSKPTLRLFVGMKRDSGEGFWGNYEL